MRIFTTSVFAGALLALSLGAGAQGSNQPTKACGTFAVNGAGHNFGGVDCDVSFNFSPSQQKCGVEPCVCNRIAYLQIIRARDTDNNIYIQPFDEQEERMVVDPAPQLTGWAVDRLPPNEWGYFAAINDTDDPISFDADNLTVGTNVQPKQAATMNDRPERWKRRVQFEAVSVPVCMDASGPCSRKMLGFETWRFRVQNNKKGTKPTHAPSTHWEREAVRLAIAKWNSEASASMQQFPELQPLSEE